MSLERLSGDPVFDAMAGLRTHDVQRDRADRLRQRCHHVLASRATASEFLASPRGVWRRLVAPVSALWCVAYLLEIIHRVAAVYGIVHGR